MAFTRSPAHERFWADCEAPGKLCAERDNQAMHLREVLDASPARLSLRSTPQGGAYELARDLVAVHGGTPGPEAVAAFEAEDIAVEPVSDAERRGIGQNAAGPVYRHVPGGGLAVPTGRAFVRFVEGDAPSRHEAELAAAGYELEEVPSYAPQAAWVRAASGRVADALQHLDRLGRLPGVESVEPQLLVESAHRD